MRKPNRSLLISIGISVLAVGLTTTTALATTGSAPVQRSSTSSPRGWSVNEMNTSSGLSSLGPVVLTDSVTGARITCRGATGSLDFAGGMGLRGALASGGVQFDSCTLPGGATVALTAGSAPVTMTGVSFDPSTHLGVTSGRWKGLHDSFSSSTCSGDLDGTAAAANDGALTYQYYNNPGWLILRSWGGNLHAYNITGCAGIFGNGDTVTISGTFPMGALLLTSP